ncbi:MAG: hypothetical protein ACRCT8_01545, partial [Lacipirellulaceae bacterium]
NPAEVAPARPRRPHHAVREGGAARLAATLVQVLKACRDDRKELTLALLALVDESGGDAAQGEWRPAASEPLLRRLAQCVEGLSHANELRKATWIAIDDSTAAALVAGAGRQDGARWFGELARAATDATGLRADVGLASVPHVPKGFEPARLVAAAERCLAAAQAAAAAGVKSIEVL